MRYYILSGDPKRKERISKRLSEVEESKAISFVDSVFPDSEEYKKNATCPVSRVGVFGCFRSHLKAMRLISLSEEEGGMIVEDDIMFAKGFKEKAEAAVSEFKDYNLILFSPYISCTFDYESNKVSGHGFLLDQRIYSAGCYYIKKAYAAHVLSVYDRPFHLYPLSVRSKACDELFTTHSGGVFIYPPLAVEECISTSIDDSTMTVAKRAYWAFYGFDGYGSLEDITLSLEGCVSTVEAHKEYFRESWSYVSKLLEECRERGLWRLAGRLFMCARKENQEDIGLKAAQFFNGGKWEAGVQFFSAVPALFLYNSGLNVRTFMLDALCLTLYYTKGEEIIYPLGLLLRSCPRDSRIQENIKYYQAKALSCMKASVSSCICGRLGNQLFQFSHAYALSKKYAVPLVNVSHEAYPLFDFIPYCPYVPQEARFEFENGNYKEVKLEQVHSRLGGYMQSAKFFEAYKPELVALYKARSSPYPRETKKHHVAIHVRRTDYLTLDNDFVIPLNSYYQEAMALFPDSSFVVFSDDIPWCKKNLKGDNLSYNSRKGTDVEEMMSMSSFDSFILCNSTFGWWAAWLSEDKKDKKVVALNRWWYPKAKNEEMLDTVPSSWIRLDPKQNIDVLLPLPAALTENLEETFASLKAQSYDRWTCLLGINKGDKNKAELVRLSKDDSRFKILEYEAKGRKSLLNAMVKDCAHDVVALLEPGAVWHQDKLAHQIKIWAQGGYEVVGCEGGYSVNSGAKTPISPTGPISPEYFIKSNPILSSSALLSKKAAKWEEAIPYEDDYPLWLSLNLEGYKFYNIPKSLVQLHPTASNPTHSKLKEDMAAKYANSVTVASCFYRSSSENEDDKKLNGLLSLSCNLALFLDPKDLVSKSLIAKSNNGKVKVFDLPLESFHMHKYPTSLKTEWNYERPFFIERAIRENYFGSSWFVWVDAKCLTEKEQIMHIKEYVNVYKLLKEIRRDKLSFFTAGSLSEENKEFKEQSCDLYEPAQAQSWFIAGHKQGWASFIESYREKAEASFSAPSLSQVKA